MKSRDISLEIDLGSYCFACLSLRQWTRFHLYSVNIHIAANRDIQIDAKQDSSHATIASRQWLAETTTQTEVVLRATKC